MVNKFGHDSCKYGRRVVNQFQIGNSHISSSEISLADLLRRNQVVSHACSDNHIYKRVAKTAAALSLVKGTSYGPYLGQDLPKR